MSSIHGGLGLLHEGLLGWLHALENLGLAELHIALGFTLHHFGLCF